jgi:hypothetical protein
LTCVGGGGGASVWHRSQSGKKTEMSSTTDSDEKQTDAHP